jgi:DMSO/TMAO reductase YedYZ molybdopterin-dependent catalytic subunit
VQLLAEEIEEALADLRGGEHGASVKKGRASYMAPDKGKGGITLRSASLDSPGGSADHTRRFMNARSTLTRRRFLRDAGLAGAAMALGGAVARAEDVVRLPFENGERRLVQFPQKRPLLLLTHRPPQLETPFAVFNEGVITPNDAFFVRYHLANIPLEIDPDQFRLEVKGLVKTPLSLSLDSLRKDFEPVEVVAVNQCSGNSRGFFQPRVGGGQLGNGAMGNARWRGARLKDVLEKAGVQAGAKQVICDGLDKPVNEKTPDFTKALEVDHALDGEMLLAYSMNDADLPMLNGFPLRLVVPGYYGTYWIKHVNSLTVVGESFGGFWMSTAYRIPATPGACVEPGTTAKVTTPIGRFNVRSFITSHADGVQLAVGREALIRGVAFDGGSGIREVLFSADGGRTWTGAQLGRDLGRYSFREWTIAFTPSRAGAIEMKCRAINALGESQPMEPLWNPAGYMRNVVETVKLTAA